jgi:hypothetical protein
MENDYWFFQFNVSNDDGSVIRYGTGMVENEFYKDKFK